MFTRSLTLVTLLLLLAACGPSSQTRPDDAEQRLQREQQAMEYINLGDYSSAGEEYLRLAEDNRDHAGIYRLKAAAAFHEDSNFDRAREILTSLDTGDNANQGLQKRILLAKINLGQGDPKSALDGIGSEPGAEAPANLVITWHEIKATALEQLGLLGEALQQRLLLTTLPITGSDRQQNDQSLWRLLAAADTAELETMRTTGPEFRISWAELALIYRTHAGNPKNLKLVLDDWSARYPGHSAITNLFPEIIAASDALLQRPQHLALLLPMDGRYQDASRAIRDGFVAAWHDDDETDKPLVSIYNTDSLNINENYRQAVTDGADFIVGPLEKTAIENLLEQGTLDAKTLVLNYYDGNLDGAIYEHVTPGTNFFQIALSPENEAEQVADRAWFEGYVRALAITTGDEWGKRMLAAFQTRWQELGGVLLEQTTYTSDIEDYSEPVRKLLNTDSSERRAKELRAVLNRRIHSEERRRQDADFIFIAARPNIARQVMPHIRFLRAGELPVYATSHVFTGQPDPVRDADLNFINFADIPWILNPDFNHSRAKSVIDSTWPRSAANYQRLYALGYDAYAVIPELPGLAADGGKRFNGATGDLYLAQQGRIRRYLTWAQFIDGQPQLLTGTAP